MERQYKAFISYRHLPLDKETAIQVHRAIEHFVIPKALRKDGQLCWEIRGSKSIIWRSDRTNHRLLVNRYLDGIYSAPFYTSEQLISLAEMILGTG